MQQSLRIVDCGSKRTRLGVVTSAMRSFCGSCRFQGCRGAVGVVDCGALGAKASPAEIMPLPAPRASGTMLAFLFLVVPLNVGIILPLFLRVPCRSRRSYSRGGHSGTARPESAPYRRGHSGAARPPRGGRRRHLARKEFRGVELRSARDRPEARRPAPGFFIVCRACAECRKPSIYRPFRVGSARLRGGRWGAVGNPLNAEQVDCSPVFGPIRRENYHLRANGVCV